MLKEFKDFLFRGNVIDLAVGVVVGAAFSAIVTALVADFLTPFISAIIKVPDFSGYVLELGGGKFLVGHFVNALVSFALIAFSIFFFVIRPVNYLVEKSKKKIVEEIKTKSCTECLGDIPLLAKRCSHCGQLV